MQVDSLIIGAGIIGLATAWHLKRLEPSRRVVVLEQAAGPCRGNSGRSAALARNLFSSKTSRDLAEASIEQYRQIAKAITYRPIGYLWHFDQAAWGRIQAAAERLARHGQAVQVWPAPTGLAGMLAEPEGWPALGGSLYGQSCGSLSAPALAAWYEAEFQALGGEVFYNRAVSRILTKAASGRDLPERYSGVLDAAGQAWQAEHLVACTGCWLQDLLGPAGIASAVYPKKRQLFALPIGRPEQLYGDWRGEQLYGDWRGEQYPARILPYGGIYLKPVLDRGLVLVGRADDLGRPFELPYSLGTAKAEPEFFRAHIEPALRAYFPSWAADYPDGFPLRQAWAGHYDYHWPDMNPVIEQQANLIWIGGSSGSGIMKADSLGRLAAARLLGQPEAELADGRSFRVADISLSERAVEAEDLVI